MAKEDEYNGTVVYLMSDAASYVTGTTIMLDGGWTAW
jgi:NAD(P)-dependent dehydrogenase (short-subunit alcohol dehydrogenase family)